MVSFEKSIFVNFMKKFVFNLVKIQQFKKPKNALFGWNNFINFKNLNVCFQILFGKIEQFIKFTKNCF